MRKILAACSLIILCLIGFLPVFKISAAPTCSPSPSATWQICGPIEIYNGLDLQPTVLQALNGSLWLAWAGNHDANNIHTANLNILYATRMTNGTWRPTSLLTNLGGKNQMPAIAQTNDGTIYVFWSYYPTSSKHSQLEYRTFNGNSWSGYTQVPVSNPKGLNDTGPSATVARDGTLHLAWTRDNSTASGSTPVMRQLWYKTLKGGVWSSSETSITSSSDVNWNWQPSLMVGKDGILR